MMLNHQLEEQSVERQPGGDFELTHFRVGQHARHAHEVRLMMGVDIGDRLFALP